MVYPQQFNLPNEKSLLCVTDSSDCKDTTSPRFNWVAVCNWSNQQLFSGVCTLPLNAGKLNNLFIKARKKKKTFLSKNQKNVYQQSFSRKKRRTWKHQRRSLVVSDLFSIFDKFSPWVVQNSGSLILLTHSS